MCPKQEQNANWNQVEIEILILKGRDLPRTNSTKSETQNISAKKQQNEHTPGIPPPGPGTPLGAGTPQTRHPPGLGTPQTRHPPDQAPPQTRHPPNTRHSPNQAASPQCRACWEIRSTRGRYASYWNAILCCNILTLGLCYFFKRLGMKMFQNLTFCRYQWVQNITQCMWKRYLWKRSWQICLQLFRWFWKYYVDADVHG